ncbi:MAG: hypothetical protein PW734_00835 [Verrucomicrobium sp.]|nr:hypothetical protein [Verrucomicrobium sp.]
MRLLLLSLALGLFPFCARADVALHVPDGNYAHRFGGGVLKDPDGKTYTAGQLRGKVVVAIFSAPNISQGGTQERWADALATNPATKVPDSVALFLVEDMTQAGMFAGMARDSMKKSYTPGTRPILVLDETGAVFRKFGVKRNATELLIYDPHGALRDVETDLSDIPATAKRVRAICRMLQREADQESAP